MRHVLGGLIGLVLVFLGRAADAPPPAPAPTDYAKANAAGPLAVARVDYDWQDAARRRAVPVRVHYPTKGDGPCPVIVFSHGLGGTREGYGYLGRHWASYGYVSVHVQHLGSDDAAWRGQDDKLAAMKRSLADPANAINRPKDVSFVVDELAKLNPAAGPLKGRLDLKRLAIAGHSFGAWTTLAAAGMRFVRPGGGDLAAGDPRFVAAMPMSPPVIPRPEVYDRTYGGIRLPTYHLTGTADQSLISDTKPEQRRIPFDHGAGDPRYLLILKDGDHMVFAQAPRPGARGQLDQRHHDLILMSSVAFWDAYLKDLPAAREWLQTGFAQALGADGTFEQKAAAAGAPDKK